MNTLISVIIPVYNVEKFLKKCIDSVLSQTYHNLEIILVDDGSPDYCGQICDEYEKQDKRIRVIHNENGGLSVARNCGLDLATGDWIGFVDSDDYIAEDMLENLLISALQEDADMAITGIEFVTEEGVAVKRYLPRNKILSGGDTIAHYLKSYGGNEYVWNKLYKKELFHKIRFPQNRLYEDCFIMYQLMASSKKVAFTSHVGYFYLQRSQAITNSLDIIKQIDSLKARLNKMDFIKNQLAHLIPLMKQEIIQNCGWLFIKLYEARIQSNNNELFEEEKDFIIKTFRDARRGAAYPFLSNRITTLLISISPKLYFRVCRLCQRC